MLTCSVEFEDVALERTSPPMITDNINPSEICIHFEWKWQNGGHLFLNVPNIEDTFLVQTVKLLDCYLE